MSAWVSTTQLHAPSPSAQCTHSHFRHGREGGHPRQVSANSISLPSHVCRPILDITPRFVEEVPPLGVHAVNEPDLPGPLPFLEARFAKDRRCHRLMHLVVNELTYAVRLREPFMEALPVLAHAPMEIARHTHVEHAVRSARENIDARSLLLKITHASEIQACCSRSGFRDNGEVIEIRRGWPPQSAPLKNGAAMRVLPGKFC